MEKVAATVYLLTNRANGKRYVGVTKGSPCARFKRHVYDASRAPTTYLRRAIAKHGAAAFDVSVLACSFTPEAGAAAERELIQSYAPEYNQTNGGEFTVGRRVAREIIERIAAANRGCARTPEMNAANSAQAKARHADPAYREKMLAALVKARAAVDENKRRLAVGASARNRVWSAESRAKLSASRRLLHMETV